MSILLGNAFPLGLIRRRALIEPATLEDLRTAAQAGCASFWGHTATLPAAAAVLGFDPAPRTERPALTLSARRLPVLDGVEFGEVWILAAEFEPGFRPPPGAEVTAAQIRGWQVLRISFPTLIP